MKIKTKLIDLLALFCIGNIPCIVMFLRYQIEKRATIYYPYWFYLFLSLSQSVPKAYEFIAMLSFNIYNYYFRNTTFTNMCL